MSASYINIIYYQTSLGLDVVGFPEIYDSHSNKSQEEANTISYYMEKKILVLPFDIRFLIQFYITLDEDKVLHFVEYLLGN